MNPVEAVELSREGFEEAETERPRGPCGISEAVDVEMFDMDGELEFGKDAIDGVLCVFVTGRTRGAIVGGGNRSLLYMSNSILLSPTMADG